MTSIQIIEYGGSDLVVQETPEALRLELGRAYALPGAQDCSLQYKTEATHQMIEPAVECMRYTHMQRALGVCNSHEHMSKVSTAHYQNISTFYEKITVHKHLMLNVSRPR